MISEIQLSRNYPSLWKKIFPFSLRLTRKINLEKKYFEDGLVSSTDPTRRALINELAFRMFKKSYDENIINILNYDFDKNDFYKKTINYITNLEIHNKDASSLSEEEISEAKTLAIRLFMYFKHYEPSKNINISPFFSGCGIVNNCKGDVFAEDTLYEIKAGNREFRSIDIRQLIVYCILQYAKKNEIIENIGLINPRLGTYDVVSIFDVIEISSGKSLSVCFNELLNFIDSPDDFR